MLDAYGTTHPGRVRAINEDAFLIDHGLQLFVVADGMGGHRAGDVASRIAVEAVQAALRRSQNHLECTWPYGIDGSLSVDANRLLTALKVANRKVFKAADASDDYTGMGTTIVAALAGDTSICCAGVGDSRVYARCGDALAQLTQDDSWLATVLAADPTMTEEDKASHPMRNVLTKVLGATATLDVDVSERVLRSGDRFLLCTDGLYRAMDDSVIETVLSEAPSASDAAKRLLQIALDGPANDNVTVLAIECSR